MSSRETVAARMNIHPTQSFVHHSIMNKRAFLPPTTSRRRPADGGRRYTRLATPTQIKPESAPACYQYSTYTLTEQAYEQKRAQQYHPQSIDPMASEQQMKNPLLVGRAIRAQLEREVPKDLPLEHDFREGTDYTITDQCVP